LPAGWAGSAGLLGSAISVQVSIGNGTEQLLNYRRSFELPSINIAVAPGTAVLGETLSVCIIATATNASVARLNIANMRVFALDELDNELPLLASAWTEEEVSNAQKCWTASLRVLDENLTEATLRVSAGAIDTLGNAVAMTAQEWPLPLTRISSCRVDAPVGANSVNAPLAFSDGSLVFGAGDNLYSLHTASCNALHSFQTGAVHGPMVVLGNSGNIALALGSSGLALLNVDTTEFTPGCMPGGSNGSAANAVFDKGLSVVAIGANNNAYNDWRFAAPANAGNQTALMAYGPLPSPTPTCTASGYMSSPIALTPAQNGAGSVLAVHDNALTARAFSNNQWSPVSWAVDDLSLAGDVSGIALDDGMGSLWLSSGGPAQQGTAPAFLQLWGIGDNAPVTAPFDRTFRVSAAAIDEQGNAFVVAYVNGRSDGFTGYELLRLDAAGDLGDRHRFPAGTGNVVGSPILGASGNLYVVSAGTQGGTGKVFAFNVGNLSNPLWTVDLGFPVSYEAQPVLVSNGNGNGTLWVVGTEGQVRGIHVASNGLSGTAQWPKAFRDNCNTSSKLVTQGEYPTCF
jgi:hypothetical protein